ncbi:MAG: hypothetical protein K8T91_01735 [Planctomycetes bacterium]|nr:hypothetical protein [Planctomycetota bacterium]
MATASHCKIPKPPNQQSPPERRPTKQFAALASKPALSDVAVTATVEEPARPPGHGLV